MRRLRRELDEVRILLTDIPAWVVSIFTASCIAMNLMANKSMDLPVSWITADCGIMVSWASFMCMDMIVKRYGAKASVTISLLALAINLLFAALFWGAACIPGAWGESFGAADPAGINIALDRTFAGTSYILFGSATAFVVSAIVNSWCNQAIGYMCKKDNFLTFALRSYVSTFIGQFVDNFTFAILVSRNFFGWTLLQCVTCSALGAVLEMAMETIFAPLGYRICKGWDKREVGKRYRTLYTNLEQAA